MAVAGFGVGALLFIWAVGALLGGGDTPAVHGAANVRPGGVPPTSSVPSSNPPASGRLQAPGSPSSSASASTTAPSTTTAPVPTTTTTPPVPTACPDSAMRVTVTEGEPSYHVGDHPLLTLHIGNGGAVACLRDISHRLRSIEILALGGKSVLWSSAYCYSLNTNEIQLFQPRQVLSYSVTWAGRTAAPGCPTARTTVPAGSYEVVGKLGNLVGPPSLLTLR